MKLRKAAAALLAVLLITALPLSASAGEWATEEFSFTVPESLAYCFDLNTPENDPSWALAGVGDPAAKQKDYQDMSAIADFYSEDGKANILVMQKESDTSKQIYNLSTLTEEERAEFLDKLLQSKSEDITVKKEYVDVGGIPFYRVQTDGKTDMGEVHELVYGTIVNGYALNFDMYSGEKEMTEEQIGLLESMVQSVTFTEIKAKPENTVSTGDLTTSLLMLGLLVVVILIPVLYFPIKSRRDKKQKALLGEKLTEYHKAHGNNDVIPGEMRFANSTDCTREAIHKFSLYQSYIKNVGSLLVGAFLSITTLVVSFVLDSDWWIKLLAVGIAGYYGYKIFNMPHTIEKIQRKVYERGTSATAHYAFYDEAFRVSGIQSASVFPYFQISDVRRNGQYVYLYYGPDNAYMIDQYGFSLGEFEDFIKFISEKTGKKL